MLVLGSRGSKRRHHVATSLISLVLELFSSRLKGRSGVRGVQNCRAGPNDKATEELRGGMPPMHNDKNKMDDDGDDD